ELKVNNESLPNKQQNVTAIIEEAHSTTREARKRLDTETVTMKTETTKTQEENARLHQQLDEYNIQDAKDRKKTLDAEKMEEWE
ncbi:hypothetical protein OS493_039282, partial [Desmophyllum pertusum]